MLSAARRRLRRSARARILLSALLLLAAATVGSNLALRALLDRQVGDRVDAALVQEIEEFRRLAATGVDPRTGDPLTGDLARLFELFLARNVPGPGEVFLTFVDGQPQLVSADRPGRRALAQALTSLGSVESTRRWERETPVGTIQAIAVPVRGSAGARGTFVVAADTTLERREVNQAVQTASGLSLAVLLLGALVVFLFSGRVLAPLRELESTARSISDTDLSQRIDVSGDDEIADLSRAFNAMLDRLESAFASQREFVSDAGHELRTPITIIRGHLELLTSDAADREATIALVLDELDRMARFVDDLLLLARADAGTKFLHLEDLDLDLLTEELLRKASGLGDRTWTMDALGVGRLTGDRQRLTQAVMNLASNAVHQTGPGDVVAIGSALDGDRARIWVRDVGPGVARADQERIFERFARGRGGRAPGHGAGLGLSIVRVIADAHGGHAGLSSEPGHGATFFIDVPAAGPDAAEREE